MRTCSDVIDATRTKFGLRSDRELGARLGVSQQYIAAARRGGMTDPLAIKVAEALGEEPGIVLWLARTERERDPVVRKHLQSWGEKVGKALASMPAKVAAALLAPAMALGLLLPAREAHAATLAETVGSAARRRNFV